MTCNCFHEAEMKVREVTGDPHAQIRGVVADVDGKWGIRPTVEILYRKKKKDGTFSAKQSSMELAYSYCPFCGKKLFDDEKIEKQ